MVLTSGVGGFRSKQKERVPIPQTTPSTVNKVFLVLESGNIIMIYDGAYVQI